MNKFLKYFALSISLIISGDLFSGDMRKIFTYYSEGEAGTFTAGGMKHWQGASFSARNRLTEPNLYSIELPSLKAGCSGIDFHAGGFSLVTKDEIVQMARGIAQGAPGYFFNLAIGAICSSCLQAINEFMQKLHKFNDLTKNSCNKFWSTATNMIGNGVEKQAANNQSKGALAEAFKGRITSWGDTLDRWYADLSPGLSAGGLSTDTAKEIHNENIIFRRLIESYDSSSNIPVPGVSVNNFELIMSLYGTYVIEAVDGDTKLPKFIPYLPSLTPEELVFGKKGMIKFWTCPNVLADPKCLKPHTTEVNDFEGLHVIINDVLNKDQDSIIPKISRRENLSAEQVDFITAHRLPYLNMAREAKNFRHDDLANFFALQLSQRIVSELFDRMVKTLNTSLIFSENKSLKLDQKEKLKELMRLGDVRLKSMDKKAEELKENIAKAYSMYSSIEHLTETGR